MSLLIVRIVRHTAATRQVALTTDLNSFCSHENQPELNKNNNKIYEIFYGISK